MNFLSRKTANRLLGALIIVGFLVVSVAMIHVQKKADDRAPGIKGWRALKNQVVSQLRDGDVIRIVPFWDNLGRTVFQDTVKGSETWPFRALDWRQPHDPIVWMRFDRLIQVGRSDWVHKDRAVLPLSSGDPVVLAQTERLLAVSVALPESPLRWSATDHEEEMVVRRRAADGSFERCRWRKGYHDCQGSTSADRGKSFVDVKRSVMDAGDAPRECFYVEPTSSSVELRFTSVPLKPGQTLLLRSGNSIQGARKEKGGRLTITMKIDDQVVVDDSYHRNDYLWIPWAVTMEGPRRSGAKNTHAVTISVSTAKAGWRQECLDLHVLDPGWETWGPVGYGHPHAGSSGVVPVRKSTFSP